MTTATRAERIDTALRAALQPSALAIEDQSAHHVGHAGAGTGGETHYAVMIESPVFTELGRVARHRLVTTALVSEFASGLHALSIVARAPGER